MSDFCKYFLLERTCLLRELAKGVADEDAAACSHCQATVTALERHRIFAEQVAEKLGGLIESEPGYSRASKLAQDVWQSSAGDK